MGGGVSFYQFHLEAGFARFGILGDFAGQPNLNLITATATQQGDDWTASYNVGALLEVAPRVKAGVTYRVCVIAGAADSVIRLFTVTVTNAADLSKSEQCGYVVK